MEDPASVRSFYKELIRLRKDPAYRETIVYGTLEPVWEDRHNLMAYYRKGEKTLLVVGNFQRGEQEIVLPQMYQKVLINNYPDVEPGAGTDAGISTVRMKGYQVLVLEM